MSKLLIGQDVTNCFSNRMLLERVAKECESHVYERIATSSNFLSTTEHGKLCRKLPRPFGKAKYILRPIVDKFREGKVKRTPGRGVK